MDQSLGEDPDAAGDEPIRHAVDQRAEALRPCVGVLRVATKSLIVRVHGVPARGVRGVGGGGTQRHARAKH
jgi:hypothetical protein